MQCLHYNLIRAVARCRQVTQQYVIHVWIWQKLIIFQIFDVLLVCTMWYWLGTRLAIQIYLLSRRLKGVDLCHDNLCPFVSDKYILL